MSKTPQLFHIGPETDEPTPLELAAKNHLAYLKDQGLLGKQHELISQLVLDLAKAVGVGAQSAKTSTPLAAAQLLAAMERLPQMTDATTADQLQKTLKGLSTK